MGAITCDRSYMLPVFDSEHEHYWSCRTRQPATVATAPGFSSQSQALQPLQHAASSNIRSVAHTTSQAACEAERQPAMTAGVLEQVDRSSSLAALAVSLRQTSQGAPNVTTQDFVSCCEKILPFFDHLGPVFHVARSEFQGKLDTLKQLIDSKPLLKDVVAADKAANVATVKNSSTRNLHRLASAIRFIQLLFERLVSGSKPAAAGQEAAAAGVAGNGVTLREAASSAYEEALAPIHTTIVRGVVRAGMMALPSRETFMTSIGETEESALPRAEEVVAACVAVYGSVMKLFEGIDMPASNVWFWPGK